MTLIEKIRKARELMVEVNGHQFTIRRPTDEEAINFSSESFGLVDIVKLFTVGWNLTELDLIPGGGGEPVKFDHALFCEWVADQPIIWQPLGEAIMKAYSDHAAKREDAKKN